MGQLTLLIRQRAFEPTGMYAHVSSCLPITSVVKSIKGSRLGTFEDAWQHPQQQLVSPDALATVMAVSVAGALAG